jgi:hypothetical protein
MREARARMREVRAEPAFNRVKKIQAELSQNRSLSLHGGRALN